MEINRIETWIEEMICSLERWFSQRDYWYIECNHVPECLLGKKPRVNMLLRTIYRLNPINLRPQASMDACPLTPQTQVALLKAYNLSGHVGIVRYIYKRVFELISPQTRNFALKQGIRISTNLYENSPETPTPLNTVWFGQFLLDTEDRIIPKAQKQNLLLSICRYLVEELGYQDYGGQGVYFYYGPTLTKVIYNASALISAFLLRVGHIYSMKEYSDLGFRGISYIVNNQNEDGSWFYAAPPERSSIDCFHQSYVLQALHSAKEFSPELVSDAIRRGEDYYRSMFVRKGNYIIPIRYDKRFTPHNTWLFQKLDGRDIGEALIYFSRYSYDQQMLEGLLTYLYQEMYLPKRGYIAPEIFIYGRNRIPYSEFQAWYLYALYVVQSTIKAKQNEGDIHIS
ncbi:hypothetical protein CS544_04860 [Porphyromonas gingivalis]|nr:hypothetical protein CS544_04860 [Porphyromonas gingivalis]